jgi:predicted amidohydrolase
MRAATSKFIDIGLAHLGRFAFFTRDNPFLSSTAALELPPARRRLIGALLEGDTSVTTWLGTAEGRQMINRVRIGCVPRDLQLVTQDGVPSVGVESVHAFLQAPLFWWLVSILWTISAGRRLDSALGDHVTGYRLATRFVADPGSHGVMFRSRTQTYAKWKRFPSTVADEYRGDTFVATTVDIRNFYYSIAVLPSTVISTFTASAGLDLKLPRSAIVLTELLDALHIAYASACKQAEPRRPAKSATAPLPVGPPSSQVLANLVMSIAAADLLEKPHVTAVSTYADDLILVSSLFPEVRENATEYLSRIDIIDENKYLVAPTVAPLASLDVGLEKSSTVFVRAVEKSEEGPEPDPDELEALDPYIDGEPSPEWGGGLLTVLRAPYKRDRLPKALVSEIRRLVDEIRVGLDKDEATIKVRSIVDEIDSALFLAVRPYWSDLLVAAVAALGVDAVKLMTDQFDQVVESLEPPPEATDATVAALYFGLRASWIHALSQAVSVALGRAERDALVEERPELVSGGRIGDMSTGSVMEYANRLRARRLVAPAFVATPLAEFTDWPGSLIGECAAESFLAWCLEAGASRTRSMLTKHVKRAVRFVPLHEACLAVHIWADPGSEQWFGRVRTVLSAQPLINGDTLASLLSSAQEALEPGGSAIPESEEQRKRLLLRFAIPSMMVSGHQLRVQVDEDRVAYGRIAQMSRRATMRVVLSAINRKADVLVLPEWSVLPELLPWIMQRAAKGQLLTIVGQAPIVRAGVYSNLLWTGIPLRDELGREACLVPPPRAKSYLSPDEREILATEGVVPAAASRTVPVYRWRGFTLASLICFEFADIAIRDSLRTAADLLTVSSWNRDWRYFDAIQEATTRDNYCLTVCVNTGSYPGTRIMRPTSSAKSVVAAVQGSEDPTVVTRLVDLTPIVAARVRGMRPDDFFDHEPADDATLGDYKPMPPAWS